MFLASWLLTLKKVATKDVGREASILPRKFFHFASHELGLQAMGFFSAYCGISARILYSSKQNREENCSQLLQLSRHLFLPTLYQRRTFEP